MQYFNENNLKNGSSPHLGEQVKYANQYNSSTTQALEQDK